MMENNDIEITLKIFQDLMLDDISEKQNQNCKEQNNEKQEYQEMKKTIPKQLQQEQKPVQEKQSNISELSKQLADALGEDFKQVHDGMKSKLFYNYGANQTKELLSNNQSNVQVSIPQQFKCQYNKYKQQYQIQQGNYIKYSQN
ncbi:unnamed protein product [Paramecium sonneborni]|uniref:Uncharacterized protein n=1 Tax=Paramecium sonneborni TaxID=65129 RepID=A0A8S1QFG1_9CILI|nr:unnamed protein product [Paramecium sonneborni]